MNVVVAHRNYNSAEHHDAIYSQHGTCSSAAMTLVGRELFIIFLGLRAHGGAIALMPYHI